MTESYPLHWPQYKPRAQSVCSSKFGDRSIDGAIKVLRDEARLLRAENLIVSTNIKLRTDGNPYSSQKPPMDKAVAVYFRYKNRDMCFACDRWDKVQDNIYAIAMTIEALRGIERWGSGDMVQQAFTGFVALPAPKSPYKILGVNYNATPDEIEKAYRKKAIDAQTDLQNGNAIMQELNEARDRLRKEFRGGSNDR